MKISFGSSEMDEAFAIRDEVFVVEQKVDPSIEYEFEEESEQFIAYIDGLAAGTARWRKTSKGIKLERFAVLSAHRRKGVASALVEALLKDIELQNAQGKIYLHAQVTACSLYRKHGFVEQGDQFLEADIWHYLMVLPLKS